MSNITRRDCLKTVGLGAAALATGCATLGKSPVGDDRPNIVVIYSDDQAISELGCYGGEVLSPHIDSLARDGMKFERFYISSPVCCPSRYSLLTGRHASRSRSSMGKYPPGTHINIGWEAVVHGERNTLPKILQKSGYRTGFVGKWHQGSGTTEKVPKNGDPEDPRISEIMERNYKTTVDAIRSSGFDEVASAYTRNVAGGGWLPKGMQHHNQEWVTDGALKFIERNHGAPFFLYMPTTLVHSPKPLGSLKADPRITANGYLKEPVKVQPSREDVLERVRAAGFPEETVGVTWLDDGVGAILKKLAELGLADNTIVMFASDNGNKGKFSCYDIGARMPFLVRWPKKVKPGMACNELVSNIDIAATIYDLCGISVPKNVRVDGRSIRSLLENDGQYKRDSLFLEIGSTRAIVSKDGFKYIALRFSPEVQEEVSQGAKYSHWAVKMDEKAHHTYDGEKLFPGYFDADQLYDLKDDSEEQVNLADDQKYKKKLEEMKRLLRDYSRDLPHTFGEFKQ